MSGSSPSKSSSKDGEPAGDDRSGRFVWKSTEGLKFDRSQSTGRKFDLRPKAKAAAE